MPKSKIINLIDEIKSGNFGIFSNYLKEKIIKGMKDNKKVLLFVGRRGYANVLICKNCGTSIKCPNCDVSLVLHKHFDISKYQSEENILVCHHCEHEQKIPNLCPNCGNYQIKGVGVGIQKVKSELKKNFPEIEVLEMDSDSIKNNSEALKIIDKFNNQKSILVATQMALTYRHYLKLHLIGVVNSDTLINIPDYKTQNKLFRQLYLLKNMAREEFVIQTRSPKNKAILKAVEGDFKNFNLEELENRKLFEYPPYSRLIKLTFRHQDKNRAFKEAALLVGKLQQAAKFQITNSSDFIESPRQSRDKFQINSNDQNPNIKIIGPSPAYIPKVAKKWIFNIIIKMISSDIKERNQLLRFVPSDWIIEVDPRNII